MNISLSALVPENLVSLDGFGSPAPRQPLSSARTKHIDVRFHFIRELTRRSKTISVEYVPTKEQRADILTKALTGVSSRNTETS